MKPNIYPELLSLLFIILLSACQIGPRESDEARTARIAADIFATLTASAPTTTSTPTNTGTPTSTATQPPTSTNTLTPTPTATDTPPAMPTPSPTNQIIATPTEVASAPTALPTPDVIPQARVIVQTANLRAGPGTNYPVVGQVEQDARLTLTGRDADPVGWWQVLTGEGTSAWISAQVVEATQTDQIAQAASPPPPPQPHPAASDQNWVLVADSSANFPARLTGSDWSYLWSKGRNNFNWQDMEERSNQCYHAPNEFDLEICRDFIQVDSCETGELAIRDCSRGDAALLWKARQGGTYRFEWDSAAVNDQTVLRFYKHLDYWGSRGPGTDLPYSAVVEDVIEWELFFWVPQYSTSYRVKVYRLQP